MTITELVKAQLFEITIMMCAGILLSVVYFLYRGLLDTIKINMKIKTALELVIWVFAAVLIGEFLYYCAYGALSVHAAGALLLGVLLWRKFFYGIMAEMIFSVKARVAENVQKKKAEPGIKKR